MVLQFLKKIYCMKSTLFFAKSSSSTNLHCFISFTFYSSKIQSLYFFTFYLIKRIESVVIFIHCFLSQVKYPCIYVYFLTEKAAYTCRHNLYNANSPRPPFFDFNAKKARFLLYYFYLKHLSSSNCFSKKGL